QGIAGAIGSQGAQGPQASITPTVDRYFHIVNLDFDNTRTIPANEFTNDNGLSVSEFLLVPNSYISVFLNGILQPANTYSITSNGFSIYPNGISIYVGSSIIFEIVSFS
ncbi:DUF4183 domain-containing protein, partial [Bacillus sp. JJ722]|uniref:DUF4183 domain-containing protein n=1 Tax=Bacillus sp. JJ722 TaxID=3122973 RepID=UPI002FFFD01B